MDYKGVSRRRMLATRRFSFLNEASNQLRLRSETVLYTDRRVLQNDPVLSSGSGERKEKDEKKV